MTIAAMPDISQSIGALGGFSKRAGAGRTQDQRQSQGSLRAVRGDVSQFGIPADVHQDGWGRAVRRQWRFEMWRSFLTDQYAKTFAKTGGIGIASHVYEQLLSSRD